MARRKQFRFEDLAERDNVLEAGKDLFTKIKGNWHQQFFNNQHPITLELACGRGEYTTGLAKLHPNRNFIGVDLKGDRLWMGSTESNENSLTNTGFLRTHILTLDQFFEADEVDEIWIVFPDPRPRDRDEKRRLTHPRFLDLYKSIMKTGGWVRLKTDNTALYEYTLEVLKTRNDISDLHCTDQLYQSDLVNDHYDIKTRFEQIFTKKGEEIKYLKFKLH